LAVHEGFAHRALADAGGLAGRAVARDDEGVRAGEPEVGCEGVGLAFQRQPDPAVERILAQQAADVRLVLALRHREGETAGDIGAAGQAALSSVPFQVGSPSGKWSRLATSTRCMPLITKKLRNMKASARLTGSMARRAMLAQE